MSVIVLVGLWLSFVLPLVVAAVGRHRRSTKLFALLALAVVLALNWLLVIVALASLDDVHATLAQTILPFLILYAVVAFASFRRKLA